MIDFSAVDQLLLSFPYKQRPLSQRFDFDHHYPKSENNSVAVVLYGRIGSLSFQRFHEQLEYLANNGEVHYILRHYLQVGNTCLIFHVLGFAAFVYHAFCIFYKAQLVLSIDC